MVARCQGKLLRGVRRGGRQLPGIAVRRAWYGACRAQMSHGCAGPAEWDAQAARRTYRGWRRDSGCISVSRSKRLAGPILGGAVSPTLARDRSAPVVRTLPFEGNNVAF